MGEVVMLLADATVEAKASNVAPARHLVRDILQRWHAEAVLEDALLVFSELITNAVRYDGPLVDVHLCLDHDVLRCCVDDGTEADSIPAVAADPGAERGRGLQIVEALARTWGVEPLPSGKRVWFEMDLPK
jgi:anti-sigma regulatory factor (Ser/Thr protein kinase)